jgi:hypothetical protein
MSQPPAPQARMARSHRLHAAGVNIQPAHVIVTAMTGPSFAWGESRSIFGQTNVQACEQGPDASVNLGYDPP